MRRLSRGYWEAFAVQNLGMILGIEAASGCTIDQCKWNPNGGIISFGHPNGAFGGRVVQFTVRELERWGGKYGLFASCSGGLDVTTIIEKLRR